MFKPVLRALEKEISGAIALSHVAEVAKHHRIQASPGIRAACEYAVSEFHKMGVDARLHSYPANGEDFDWTSLRFKEWSCEDAWLKLVEPEEKYLARFAEKKIHVIQRSISTPEGGLTAELVVPRNKGEEPEDYEGIDVKGKVVITNGDVHRVNELALVGRGAAGIIYDGMFVRTDLPEGTLDDTLRYTSFWWTPQDTPGLGWVVTPRTGRELRRQVAKGDPVKVHGYIKAELYDGYLDNAVATIPGETDEEVIVIAHICHPEPSANDNASGCGAAMEAARAISKLIDDGVLKKPMRTIRFTLVPEMAGSYSYLAEREDDIPKMVASINLDMVGEDQDQTGSVLVLHKTPDSFPSYINAVSEAIFEETQKEFKSIGGNPWMATFRHAVGEFSGGSDHYIYTDPTVGIPSVMMIQWPDKFYHTSDDTVDKVSPKSLGKVATIAATFAYFMANAGEKEAPWVASQVASREKRALSRMVQEALDRAAVYDVDAHKVDEVRDYLKEKIEFDVEVGIKALRSIKRIAPGCESTINPLISNLMAEGEEEYNHAMKILEDLAGKQGIIELPDYEPKAKDEPEEVDQVPAKLYRGPLSTRPWMRSLTMEDQEALRQLNKRHGVTYGGPSTQALYWTDGSRSIREISRLVGLETGETNLPYLVEYYGLLVRSGLAEFRNR
jgi:aminopeptidase-like protein